MTTLEKTRQRALNINKMKFTNTIDTEKAWVSKSINEHIEKYGEPKRFDSSEEAIVYMILVSAWKELKDLSK